MVVGVQCSESAFLRHTAYWSAWRSRREFSTVLASPIPSPSPPGSSASPPDLASSGWHLAGSPDGPSVPQTIFAIPVAPFVLLATLLGIGVFLIPVAVAWPFLWAKQLIRERKHRNALRSQGRFVTVDAVRPMLNAGEGTLIEDTGQKGPYRIWWTEEDLFDLGQPVSTKDKDAFLAALQGEHTFNARCLKEYLDDKTGRALLTSIPARYARTGRLAQMFPKMKVAAVVRPFPFATSKARDSKSSEAE